MKKPYLLIAVLIGFSTPALAAAPEAYLTDRNGNRIGARHEQLQAQPETYFNIIEGRFEKPQQPREDLLEKFMDDRGITTDKKPVRPEMKAEQPKVTPQKAITKKQPDAKKKLKKKATKKVVKAKAKPQKALKSVVLPKPISAAPAKAPVAPTAPTVAPKAVEAPKAPEAPIVVPPVAAPVSPPATPAGLPMGTESLMEKPKVP